MNKRDIRIKRNDTARLVRHSNRCGSHRNCIRIGKNEGPHHRKRKMLKSEQLIIKGHEILTEPIFETGGRPDILDLDTATAYEIHDSESITSLRQKAGKYPVTLRIVAIDARTGEETIIRN